MAFAGLRATGPCGCCCRCHNSDVVLLTDTTGSMAAYIGAIKSIFTSLRDQFESDTCQWLVADYKDYEDGGQYGASGIHVRQAFTSDFDLVIAAVNSLSAGGGGDLPEQNFSALKYLADQWSPLGGREDDQIKRLILWAGDAPSWNSGAKGFGYPSRTDLIGALTGAEIRVFALNIASSGAGIDGAAGTDNVGGQASAIVAATQGELVNNVDPTDEDEIIQILCRALST